MVHRFTILSVWVVLLGALLAAIGYVVYITSMTHEGIRVVEAKAVPMLHLNTGGQLLMGDGSRVAYSKSLKGWVDIVRLHPDSVEVIGWAGDKVSGRPAQSIVLLINGHFAAQGPTGGSRQDVAKAFSREGLAQSGFDITARPVDLGPAEQAKTVLSVFALNAGGEAHELEYPRDLPLRPAVAAAAR